MIEQNRPNIGIVSDCALQRHAIQKVLRGYGLNIALCCDPFILDEQPEERKASVNCWVLELQDEELECEALERLIDEAEQPILFGLGKAPSNHDESYISWERRLSSKLSEFIGPMEQLDTEESIIALDHAVQDQLTSSENQSAASSKDKVSQGEALSGRAINSESLIDAAEGVAEPESEHIWVLAASLGGPAAVKEFLDEIPANIKAGFLYAQHIDAHFSKVLTNVLGRHSKLDLKALESGDRICDGDVLVVPVDQEVIFTIDGAECTDRDWNGPYGPSIDHLLENLYRHYGNRCHVIVFSGMGNDGALMAPRMKRSGCQVWTQTPDSCANGSMPQSVIDLECVDKIATPKVLAQEFIKMVGCHPNATGEDELHRSLPPGGSVKG